LEDAGRRSGKTRQQNPPSFVSIEGMDVTKLFYIMKVESFRMDEETKAKREKHKDINLNEVIGDTIKRRMDIEEKTRSEIDKERALKASEDMKRLRSKSSGKWSGIEEIRRWREAR